MITTAAAIAAEADQAPEAPRVLTPAEQARLDELMTRRNPISYKEFGAMIDRKPQSMRSAMMRRRKHIDLHGHPRSTDILAPAGERFDWPRTEPYWIECEARAWAMQTGKLEIDGVTPKPYRGSDKKRREYRVANGLPVPNQRPQAAPAGDDAAEPVA